MKKIIGTGIIILLLIPLGLGTVTFNSRETAEAYIQDAYNNFTVSMVLNPKITADYDIVSMRNGEIYSTRVVCWKQDLTINGNRYTMDQLRQVSSTAYSLFKEEGLCILPEEAGITDNVIILATIQGEETQNAIAKLFKSQAFQNEPSLFAPNFDPEVRVNRDQNNSLVGVEPKAP